MSTGVSFPVRVTPRASRDLVAGPGADGILRVRVTAVPADGAANRAVQVLVADSLGVPRTWVSVESGASSRNKRLRIEGREAADLLRRWPGLSIGAHRSR